MMLRRSAFILAILLSIPVFCPAQNATSDDIFTISVAPPKSPADIQVRYFLADGSGPDWYTTEAEGRGNNLVVKTVVNERPARSFKAIVYAPGCQFATISADDLNAGNREAEFQCQELATTPFRGRVALPDAGQDLQVEVLYVCGWARNVFGLPEISVSPISLTKTKVAGDGSFIIDMPDFSRDPLWSSLSKDGALIFMLTDPANSRRWALKLPGDTARVSSLKVAPNYPEEIQFSAQP
jgi:hypothetical protein